MEYNDLPGLALGVSSMGHRWTGCAGVRDTVTGYPLETGDVFHCASVSKLFTSAAILKLIDAEVLGYDDLLADILPDLTFDDERARDIRLWQMLSHTASLGDVDDYHWEKALTGRDALKNYVYSDEVRTLPLLAEPGKLGFRYSNIAYEILGHIVSEKSEEYGEAVGTGKGRLSFEDFVKEYLMKPAGMDDSTMKTFERIGVTEGEECPNITDEIRRSNGMDIKPAMALPHERSDDRSLTPVRYYPYTRSHGPSSTLTSTLEDLLSWGEKHIEGFSHKGKGGLMSHDAYTHAGYEYATVPNNGEKMGLGWFMREQCGHRLYGHEGTDDGFRASFWICPELELVTVALSNLSIASVKKINIKLFDRLMDMMTDQ